MVFWLVLLLRDSSDVIVARELSRHPRLIRPLVDQVLAYKTLFALVLFSALALVGSLTLADRRTGGSSCSTARCSSRRRSAWTSCFAARSAWGWWRSRCAFAPAIYAVGVLLCVRDASRIVWVPVWLTVGEVSGIALVWLSYLKHYRLPRPRLGLRFPLDHGAARAYGLLDPALAGRDQHGGPAGRRVPEFVGRGRALWGPAPDGDGPVDVRPDPAAGGVPDSFAVVAADGVRRPGGTRFAGGGLDDWAGAGGGGVHGAGGSAWCTVLPADYAGAGFLLALGIWRAPLLILAYLYQTTLIALNRETVGVRTLVAGGRVIVPLVALFRLTFGLPGAALGVLLVGLGLVLAGYGCLAREGGSRPGTITWPGPVIASLAMVPVCLALKHYHVLLAVLGGALTYIAVWLALGGLRHTRFVEDCACGRRHVRARLRDRESPARRTTLIEHRDMEVADEVLHDHDVFRAAQLRRRRRLRRSAQPGAVPPRARGPRLLLRGCLQRRARRPPAARVYAAAGPAPPSAEEPVRHPLAAGDAGDRLALFSSRHALREALDDPDTDVVHFHNISLVGGPGVLGLGANRRAVRIMTAHEHWLICPMHLLWKYDREACDAPNCV